MKIGSLYNIFTALLLCLSSVHADAGGIYKWVDAEGTVHYGEQPPPQGAQEMTIRPGANAGQDNDPATDNQHVDPRVQRDKMIQALEGDRRARQEKKQQQQKEQQKLKMQCARAKDTLRRYKSAGGLYKLDAEGNRLAMPDSARQQETQRLEAEIRKNCR